MYVAPDQQVLGGLARISQPVVDWLSTNRLAALEKLVDASDEVAIHRYQGGINGLTALIQEIQKAKSTNQSL